ncbi:MAG: hypothetical protein P8N76_07475 [Pirellulaceae bacterium]|nr:hypothetical protein [Pirellulaceae bacterium]
MSDEFEEHNSLRYAIYALLIVITISTTTARILSACAPDRLTPFFSANDRSRWSTISAIVDHGTFEIDEVRKRPGWKSIDMVRHPGADGKEHYYSSKPPLFPTLLAGEYFLIRNIFGANLQEDTFYIARIMLVLTNVIPILVMLLLIIRCVELEGRTDFGRIFVVTCACWGTFLTTFCITLNNHLPAAICVMICVFCLFSIWRSEAAHPIYFVVSGFAAAFAAANELPALSFLAVFGAGLFWLSPKKTLLAFLPAVALVAIAFFATNYVAHQSIRPPYAHRNPGDNWYDYPGSYWMTPREGVDRGESSRAIYAFHILVGHHGIFSLTPIWILSLIGICNWILQRDDLMKRGVAAGTVLLMVVCLTFYILRPEIDRNYGGVSSGFRWMFWFIPLWLITMIPTADWLADRRKGRWLAMGLLAISTLSAQFAAGNPWSHPWIYQYLTAIGWVSN